MSMLLVRVRHFSRSRDVYLMYVDESGDDGVLNSPTQFFVLSGLVMHELRWRDCVGRIYEFRKRIKARFGLRIREEIHASHMINRPGELGRIRKNDRLAILRHFIDEIAALPDISVINVVVDKSGKDREVDIFSLAWRALIQRFENTISHRNFPGPANPDDRGMIFPDETNLKKLRGLVRRMRYYNPVPHDPSHGDGFRNLQSQYTIEDPNHRTSHDSFLIQAADTIAYFLHQKQRPCSYAKRKGAYKYFERLEPVLCTVASRSDPLGIVRL
jgi:hypothetical protein